MANLITPEKYVFYSINKHPSLYASDSFEAAKLAVYEQLFNTIGNGIRCNAEFTNELRPRRKDVQPPPAKYLSGEPLYYGYTEVDIEKYGDYTYASPRSGSCLNEVFTAAEQAEHPEVKKWVGCHVGGKFHPYPNFEKQYSIVWKIVPEVLTEAWIDEIIWFYRKCDEFFTGPDVTLYSRAAPTYPAAMAKLVEEFEQSFARDTKDCTTDEERHAVITKNWNASGDNPVVYSGDTADFIRRRWAKELARIRAFIAETISMLTLLLQEKLRLKAKLRDI